MTSSLDMIRGRSNVVTLTNKSGGALVAGDVCIIDTSNDEAATTTTSAASVLKVYIAAESIANDATGKFYSAGFCPLVTPSASTTRGRYLFTHTVAKQAAESATYGAGAFGVILKSGTTPSVWLFGSTAQGSGGGVARSGATTDAHLAVWNGSNADSIKDGGVVPAAGGRTLISEATPSGTNTVSYTSISGSYKVLTIEFAARDDRAANVLDNLNMQFNSDTTAGNYRYAQTLVNSISSGQTLLEIGNSYILTGNMAAANATANNFTIGEVKIFQYANTGFNKQAICRTSLIKDTTSYEISTQSSLGWANTAAITRIDLISANGNFVAGSVFRLYGEA